MESREDAAVRDLEDRTLASLHGELAKLVYLASTRDYNTGQYRHEGLALIYSPEAAEGALRRCHEKVFRGLAYMSLEDVQREIEIYLQSAGEDREKVLDAWRKLEAYRVLMPAECDQLTEGLFTLNVRVALAALRPAARPEWQGRPAERRPL